MPYELLFTTETQGHSENRTHSVGRGESNFRFSFLRATSCSWWLKTNNLEGHQGTRRKSAHRKRIHFRASRLHRLLRRGEEGIHRCRAHCRKADRNHEANIPPAPARDWALHDAPLGSEQP